MELQNILLQYEKLEQEYHDKNNQFDWFVLESAFTNYFLADKCYSDISHLDPTGVQMLMTATSNLTVTSGEDRLILVSDMV